MPRRTSAWSSTIRILMSSTCSPDGEHGDDHGAASRCRSDVEGPTELLGEGPHVRYPEVGVFILDRSDTTAAILDLDPHLGVGRRDAHLGDQSARVLRGIGERLAHDRVDRLEHPLVRVFQIALDLDRNREMPPDAEVSYERRERGFGRGRILVRHLEEEFADATKIITDLAFDLREGLR